MADIPKLADSRKKGIGAYLEIFDRIEGAGIQSRKVTAKQMHDELGATFQGLKSHEVGEGNHHSGNHSLAYGEDLVTGSSIAPFTCSLGSKILTLTGIDLTDDYRVGDVVRVQYGDGTLFAERVVDGSTFGGGDTTITLDQAVAGITAGNLFNHALGSRALNIGQNNQIKGEDSAYIGVGGRIIRDVVGALGSGIRNWFRHGATRGMGYDGNTHWSGEDYRSYGKINNNGDRKGSIVMLGARTTNAAATRMTFADGSVLNIPDDSSATLLINLNGTQIDGAAGTPLDSYGLHIEALVKNIGGTLTIVDQTNLYEKGDVAFAGSATLGTDDPELYIEVTGEVSKNIVWTAEVKIVINIIA